MDLKYFFLALSFEDKRRENFRQGQAELDRRKQELAEKMRLDEEIRLENERLEREKQQKLRYVFVCMCLTFANLACLNSTLS